MTEYVSIKEDVLKKLEANLPEIRERFGIETIGICGSVSRGEDSPDSDVDVLYAFAEDKATLRNLLSLHEYLSLLFHREVDVIPIEFVTPVLMQYLQRDAILYGTVEIGAA